MRFKPNFKTKVSKKSVETILHSAWREKKNRAQQRSQMNRTKGHDDDAK